MSRTYNFPFRQQIAVCLKPTSKWHFSCFFCPSQEYRPLSWSPDGILHCQWVEKWPFFPPSKYASKDVMNMYCKDEANEKMRWEMRSRSIAESFAGIPGEMAFGKRHFWEYIKSNLEPHLSLVFTNFSHKNYLQSLSQWIIHDLTPNMLFANLGAGLQNLYFWQRIKTVHIPIPWYSGLTEFKPISPVHLWEILVSFY